MSPGLGDLERGVGRREENSDCEGEGVEGMIEAALTDGRDNSRCMFKVPSRAVIRAFRRARLTETPYIREKVAKNKERGWAEECE